MATLLNLKKAFATGQGAGYANYFTYSEDHDSNYTQIETSVNQLVQEVRAFLGQNSLLPIDILTANDADGLGDILEGVIGGHSYEVAIKGGDASKLTVQEGQALLASGRVERVGDVELPGSAKAGADGTRWVAIDTNGVPSLEDQVGQQAMDIASVYWNDGSSIFTGAVTQIAAIFFDGDDYANLIAVTGDERAFPAVDHRAAYQRVENIERLVSGREVSVAGVAIGPLVARGHGISVDVASASQSISLDNALENSVIEVVGAPGGARTVDIPDQDDDGVDFEKLYYVLNSTTGGQTITFEVDGGAGASVDLIANEWMVLWADGTGDIVWIRPSGPVIQPFQFGDYAAATTDTWLKAAAGPPLSTGFGVVMLRPGSIIGFSGIIQVSLQSATGDVKWHVTKNGADVLTVERTLDGTPVYNDQWNVLQDKNIDAFVGGDKLGLRMETTHDTWLGTVAKQIMTVEVSVDAVA